MRSALCKGLCDLYHQSDFVFLTGDLGFGALEPLQETMGERFINAGIAEQNMISVAAGLALDGSDVWVYSIAPFCYARPFEQIRNDICMHNLPVRIIGNGGGYGYGVMGASHHALEDYGILLSLKGMHAFIPAFSDDINPIIEKLSLCKYPAYLRLGRSEIPSDYEVEDYKPWRKLISGHKLVLLIVGPLVGPVISIFMDKPENMRPEIWLLSELPLEANPIPKEFLQSLRETRCLCVVEEHVAQGGVGQIISYYLTSKNIWLDNFMHLCAKGYPSGFYGSQAFHRRECGIDAENIMRVASEMRKEP